MAKLISHPVKALQGRLSVPGDKSISHRALILGGMAVGRSEITGLLEGEDVLHTAAAMRSLGATVNKQENGAWIVDGVGVGGLSAPRAVIDMGNSGTAARLLMGAVATHDFKTFFTGDASLCRRPMARVTGPLAKFGAHFLCSEGDRLPLAVTGSAAPTPIRFELPVASAQVKSAILLAGLNCPGITTVIEREPTRDHSERMLRHFGAEITVTPRPEGGNEISLKGYPELKPAKLDIPGDPSSAAFAVVAALITQGSNITLENIGVNPLRIGLYDTLRDMGGDIEFINPRLACGEPVADIIVKSSRLKGVEVPAARAPSMIDEYPILCITAAFAEGQTIMHGLAELRVKESDRLAVMARGLKACGIAVTEKPDGLMVTGGGRPQSPAKPIATEMDHRIAMSFLVLGMAADAVAIDDGAMIDTSFPGFARLMNGSGAKIESAEA